MTHIHGQQDTDLHDADGNHIRPVYLAPRERMPDRGEHASVMGPVVRGSDVERAHTAYNAACRRFRAHMDAHRFPADH